jgi:hypothetical protein
MTDCVSGTCGQQMCSCMQLREGGFCRSRPGEAICPALRSSNSHASAKWCAPLASCSDYALHADQQCKRCPVAGTFTACISHALAVDWAHGCDVLMSGMSEGCVHCRSNVCQASAQATWSRSVCRSACCRPTRQTGRLLQPLRTAAAATAHHYSHDTAGSIWSAAASAPNKPAGAAGCTVVPGCQARRCQYGWARGRLTFYTF